MHSIDYYNNDRNHGVYTPIPFCNNNNNNEMRNNMNVGIPIFNTLPQAGKYRYPQWNGPPMISALSNYSNTIGNSPFFGFPSNGNNEHMIGPSMPFNGIPCEGHAYEMYPGPGMPPFLAMSASQPMPPFVPMAGFQSPNKFMQRQHGATVNLSEKFGPGPPIVTSDRVKGPKDCNLFIFHLPNEITNWDLYLLFRKYGSILSVHTMINKTTGLSKGYGFISFSAPDEAYAAIQALDGFRLGRKRLKVQLKRCQEEEEEDYDDFPSDNDTQKIHTDGELPYYSGSYHMHPDNDSSIDSYSDIKSDNEDVKKGTLPSHSETDYIGKYSCSTTINELSNNTNSSITSKHSNSRMGGKVHRKNSPDIVSNTIANESGVGDARGDHYKIHRTQSCSTFTSGLTSGLSTRTSTPAGRCAITAGVQKLKIQQQCSPKQANQEDPNNSPSNSTYSGGDAKLMYTLCRTASPLSPNSICSQHSYNNTANKANKSTTKNESATPINDNPTESVSANNNKSLSRSNTSAFQNTN